MSPQIAREGFAMRSLLSKSIQLAGIRSLVFALLLLPLIAGCQVDRSTPISTPTNTSTLVPSPTIESSTEAPSKISVPQGTPSKLDGVMEPSEWDAAVEDALSDGSQLYLMHQDGYLYLAIRSITSEMIAGNVFIESGGEIAILHASAALGTAVYETGVGDWNRIQNFSWQCRNSSDSERTQAERQVFLEQEWWLASNSRMGNPN